MVTTSAELPDALEPNRRPNLVVRVLITLVVLVAAAYGGFTLYNRLQPAPAAKAPVQTATVERGNIVNGVSMSGNTVPAAQAELAFSTAGKLAELNVKVGDSVTQGQILAKLDTSDLQLTLRQQQANLTSAQAKLAQTLAGPTASDRIAAEASVVSAQAALDKANNDYTALMKPPSQDDIAAAQAALEKARASLQTAQTAYDKVSWRNDAGSTQAAVDLQSATADFQSAQAAYNLKIAPPKDTDVANAKSTITNAQKSLQSAKAKLDAVNAGSTAADIAAARASVEQANVQVATAQNNLNNATLIAPFNGIVSVVNFRQGEQVTSQGAVLSIVDNSQMTIQGVIDELNAPKVKAGQNATVTFTSIPNVTFTGKVQSRAPVATVSNGVSTYAVIIALNPQEGQELLAGLTGNITIVIEEKDNVLVVPTWAIQSQGQNKIVTVLKADGSTAIQRVQTGITDGTQTEITSGLNEGDVVEASFTPTTSTGGTNTRPGGFGGGFGGVVPRGR